MTTREAKAVETTRKQLDATQERLFSVFGNDCNSLTHAQRDAINQVRVLVMEAEDVLNKALPIGGARSAALARVKGGR